MSVILLALDPNNVPEAQARRIQSLKPDSRLEITDDREKIEPLLGEIEIAAGHFPVTWIPRAEKLRWFQQWGAGTDWLLRHPEIAGRDFILTNASGVHAIPISEHILAFMLAFARGLPNAVRTQQQRDWNANRQVTTFELAGKTVLIIGIGAIGRRTAQITSALGMRVLGIRRNASKSPPEVERTGSPEQLYEMLPEADFVVLTQPLTEETRNMFDAKAFSKMKPSAYLINIGRGGTVDEPALIQALQSKQIAGAGLDVFANEPLPPESPLWEMDNVIITAHYSGSTPQYNRRALDIFLDNLKRYTGGEPLINVVDKKRGY
ncbi:MAG: D-2-hydroxyacid dehydrogenase [Chloroflexi bacterium]|nr:D-2-hydroxyacid dehydrogenase [Chloroflexota bacterium]